MRRIFQKELDMILHWILHWLEDFWEPMRYCCMQEILVPHRPEMSWRWRRRSPEKILQKWGYDF